MNRSWNRSPRCIPSSCRSIGNRMSMQSSRCCTRNRLPGASCTTPRCCSIRIPPRCCCMPSARTGCIPRSSCRMTALCIQSRSSCSLTDSCNNHLRCRMPCSSLRTGLANRLKWRCSSHIARYWNRTCRDQSRLNSSGRTSPDRPDRAGDRRHRLRDNRICCTYPRCSCRLQRRSWMRQNNQPRLCI